MKPAQAADIAELIPDGATLMIGGFIGAGSPQRLIDELVRRGRRELTVIANDTARPGVGIGKLIDARLVRRLITSHIGTNPETQRQMIAGELQVELVPQGTLVERIRSGGFGLGGVLTPTGVGTLAAEGKRTIEIDGRTFLLELPLVNSEGPARGTPGRWRKVAAGCFVGAMPAANADAYADDFAVCAALTMLLQRQHAEIESIDGALLLRFNRPASLSVEAEVRRCLDVSRSVIAVLDKVGERLPDLHDAELPDLLPESSAPSSSGAPLLVRGIR